MEDGTENEAEELSKAIYERAASGDSTEFRLISSIDEASGCKLAYKANKALARHLRKRVESYSAELGLAMTADCRDSVQGVVALRGLIACADFYKAEADTLRDMLSEWRCYLRYGHMLRMGLLGFQRPEEDMVDWRTLPVSLF